jgi:hypothetical protein
MRTLRSVLLGIVLGAGGMLIYAQNERMERTMHPRIQAAIEHLRDAIAYMENAPHDFGGHKADAIRTSREAIRELNLALQFRAREDRRR